MDAHPVGRLDAGRLPVVVSRARHEPARHDPIAQHLARSIDVGEERLESTNPLTETGLDERPFARSDDAGHEIEREGAFLAREREGDALVAKRPIPGHAAKVEVVGRQRLQDAGQ